MENCIFAVYDTNWSTGALWYNKPKIVSGKLHALDLSVKAITSFKSYWSDCVLIRITTSLIYQKNNVMCSARMCFRSYSLFGCFRFSLRLAFLELLADGIWEIHILKIHYTYLIMLKLGIIIFYHKKSQTMYNNIRYHLRSADIRIFHQKLAIFVTSGKMHFNT